MSNKYQNDNNKNNNHRSNQLNPNNLLYWHSRGLTKPQTLKKKKKVVLPAGTFRI